MADAYDRGRPSYPTDAVRWLVGATGAHVLELGSGTGRLTEVLVSLGHTVAATDPSQDMLRRLVARVPAAHPALGTAERIPVASRSVDVVVSAQAFHWFDHERAVPEIARVLRPGGVLAVVWNSRDERIPWVRRLGEIIGDSGHESDPTRAIDDSGLFETVQSSSFRIWQPMTQGSLRDLVTSRSNVAALPDVEREGTLRKVDELYDGYGRGADGMLLPYVTRTFRATVLPWTEPDPPTAGARPGEVDTDALLIDFH